MRIVSLLPSATEILCAAGLAEDLVGVTHECDFPPRVRGLPRVTRTLIPSGAPSREIDALVRERVGSGEALYTLDLPALRETRPDLIVTQALCDVCAVAEDDVRAAASELPGKPAVLSLEPETLGQVFEAIRSVGRATGGTHRAEGLVSRLTARVDRVAARSARITVPVRVAVIEWLDPPFSSGHWGPELVRLAGGVEVVGREGERSRALTWDEVVSASPEVVLVACCGFGIERTLEDLPVLASVPGWIDTPAARSGRVHLMDGSQYLSRPGPRLVDALEILAHALHPKVHPLPRRLPSAVRAPEPSHGEKERGGKERAAGLCSRCRFRRTITSGRGSSFVLCLRSIEDSDFPKYPRLPVHVCAGFEPTS